MSPLILCISSKNYSRAVRPRGRTQINREPLSSSVIDAKKLLGANALISPERFLLIFTHTSFTGPHIHINKSAVHCNLTQSVRLGCPEINFIDYA